MNQTIERKTGFNRLRRESSPYLLQHALDPVHWYPWCEEAFQAARLEDKPIFLSIGYSTCYWCHVMGRTTFRDPETAQILNRSFISIKVDREERPDVDGVYMAACQALTGSGGWPLSILMTPDQEPFWAGTYLPPKSADGLSGLLEILEETERLWQSDRSNLLNLGQRVTEAIQNREPAGVPEKQNLRDRAVCELSENFDPQNGGFGGAPKFPNPQQLLFLLDYADRENDPDAMEMAERTITQMLRGGIFDQIGGGFCRYSTDEAWKIPHFEKMLYDNAMLAYTLLDAYTRTGRRWYCDNACRTLEYALRELRLPKNGFACAQDAGAVGEEGRYYLLTKREIYGVLGEQEGERFCRWFAIEKPGKQLPHLLDNEQYENGMFVTELEKLSDYRRRRAPLHRDEKVLTGWNAMMIAALAKAYRVTGSKRYLRAAESTRMLLRTRLTASDGTLYRCLQGREAVLDGQLEDYALYCWALLELYEANFSISCLREAARLANKMDELFQDEDHGGFFNTSVDSERLIVRQKEAYDNAYPSGNAAAALALGRLWRLTRQDHYYDLWQTQMQWLSSAVQAAPHAAGFALLAIGDDQSRQMVCVTADRPPAWLPGITEEFHLAALVKRPDNAHALELLCPHTAVYPIPKEGVQVYVCGYAVCKPPVETPEQLRAILEEN